MIKTDDGEITVSTPFTVSGDSYEAKFIAEQILQIVGRNTRPGGVFVAHIATNEEWQRKKQEDELNHENWVLEKAAEIQRRRDAAGFTP
jgi:hypothetical protein